MRMYATVFLDNGNCEAWWILHNSSTEGGYRSGFTDRNIGELVATLTKRGYHVTLYRVSTPEFHAEAQ